MIVDNDDDPFVRAGGIYLYHINPDPTRDEPITFLDYLDYDDLQIEGFRGIPYIGSADLHKTLFNREEYTLFLSEGRTGTVFVFNFEISQDKNEIVYLYRKAIPLPELIPKTVPYPTPLKIIAINIVDYTVKTDSKGEH